MGATNVIRATGKIYWGLLVWFADSFKAMAAIGIATRIVPGEGVTPAIVSAIAAIIGHNWSIFAAMLTGTLRGGKGAAAAFGTIIVIAPFQVIAGMVAIGGVALVLTRYVSLAVLLMFGLALVWLLILVNQQVLTIEYRTYALAITALIVVRFRGNITRIINGTERRLGESA